MFLHDKKILISLAAALRSRFSDSVIGIYAFGSRVRGDHSAESDFDILIIVAGKTPQIEKCIISFIVDYETERDFSFAPVIKDITAFNNEKTNNSPFYTNIINEGVLL